MFDALDVFDLKNMFDDLDYEGPNFGDCDPAWCRDCGRCKPAIPFYADDMFGLYNEDDQLGNEDEW